MFTQQVTASLMGESEQDHASILANIYLDYGLTFEEVNTDTTTQHGAHVYKLKPYVLTSLLLCINTHICFQSYR